MDGGPSESTLRNSDLAVPGLKESIVLVGALAALILAGDRKINHLVLSELPKNYDPDCFEIVKMAERELAAYLTAAKELFGAKEAELAGEYWLRELGVTKVLPVGVLEWRMVTINTERRLATRLNVSKEVSRTQTTSSSKTWAGRSAVVRCGTLNTLEQK